MNSDFANKTIKNLNAEIDGLLNAEKLGRTYSHAPNETPTIPDYSFSLTQSRLNDLRSKVAVLRHAINQFNLNTKLDGFDMTVDEGLGYMSVLNQEKKRLLALSSIPETERRREFGGKEPDIVHRNFNIAEVQVAYREVCGELMRIQQALNVANLTKEFEVNIDLDTAFVG